VRRRNRRNRGTPGIGNGHATEGVDNLSKHFPRKAGQVGRLSPWVKLRWSGGRNRLYPRVQVLGDGEGGVAKTCAGLGRFGRLWVAVTNAESR
jgi:hypothetical protein